MWAVTLNKLRKGSGFIDCNRVVRLLQNKPFTKKDNNLKSHIRFKHTDEISLIDICHINGISYALWAMRYLDSTHNRDIQLFGVWCVRQVQHLLIDERSIRAIDVVEKFANNMASEKELYVAHRNALFAYESNFHHIHSKAHLAAYLLTGNTVSGINGAAHFAACKDSVWLKDNERPEQTEMFIKLCQGKAPWQLDKLQQK